MDTIWILLLCLASSFLTALSKNLKSFARIRTFKPIKNDNYDISITPKDDDCGLPSRVEIAVHDQKLDITMNQFNELKNLIVKINIHG